MRSWDWMGLRPSKDQASPCSGRFTVWWWARDTSAGEPGSPSVRLAGDLVAAAGDQEVEGGAAVGLEGGGGVGGGGGLRRGAAGQVAGREVQAEGAGTDVEDDRVAGADQGQRAAGGRLRGDVEDHGAVRGAAHAAVADPDHVADAALQQPGR